MSTDDIPLAGAPIVFKDVTRTIRFEMNEIGNHRLVFVDSDLRPVTVGDWTTYTNISELCVEVAGSVVTYRGYTAFWGDIEHVERTTPLLKVTP